MILHDDARLEIYFVPSARSGWQFTVSYGRPVTSSLTPCHGSYSRHKSMALSQLLPFLSDFGIIGCRHGLIFTLTDLLHVLHSPVPPFGEGVDFFCFEAWIEGIPAYSCLHSAHSWKRRLDSRKYVFLTLTYPIGNLHFSCVRVRQVVATMTGAPRSLYVRCVR